MILDDYEQTRTLIIIFHANMHHLFFTLTILHTLINKIR